MALDDKIRDEKLPYDINWEAAKISALSTRKIDKYEYLLGKAILLSNEREIIEQAKFPYSPLGQVFETQTGKQLDTIKFLDTSKNVYFHRIWKVKKIDELQDIIKKNDLNFKSKRRITYNFGKISVLIVFLRDIHEGYLSLKNADLM